MRRDRKNIVKGGTALIFVGHLSIYKTLNARLHWLHVYHGRIKQTSPSSGSNVELQTYIA